MTSMTPADNEPSIGDLVKEVQTQFSNVLHGEIELAKVEVKDTVKNVGVGSGFFVLAGVLCLFSLTFMFIALAQLLAWFGLWVWAAYTIVFVFILLLAAGSVLFGRHLVKKAKMPERTIATTKSTVEALRNAGSGATP